MAYIANTDADRARMLARLGVADIDALFAEIPAELRLKRRLELPRPAAEPEVLRAAGALAERNADTRRYACFIGAGAYDHYVPSAVGHMLLRSEFYTAYTPYQPEISQGTLQCIYEYQSLIAQLTGQDAANASMYDGASALAEAALVAHNATGRTRILLAGAVHPEHVRTVRTYVQGLDLVVETLPVTDGVTQAEDVARALGPDVACVALQQPNFFGGIEDIAAIAKPAHAAGALTVVAANPIALGLLEAPGRQGADIVVGEGQPLGVALSYGGPYVGFFAVKQALMRLLPGRIVGATVDGEGRRGFVLTLQTREQHIRRERATSNICTNQALMALANTVYLTLLGP
ncbi:MAG TPA: aminomethyl-transferring glycine dehydrogenase subunit GcvPA, partial [Limnochordia bacterium]|nr:aminomethyl-transferring glycine dehydrogenase subunit GcvPA [Limnochordia bacterium]